MKHLVTSLLLPIVLSSCCLFHPTAQPAKAWVVADRAHHTFFSKLVEAYASQTHPTPAVLQVYLNQLSAWELQIVAGEEVYSSKGGE